MEFLKIFDFFKSINEIADKFENDKDKRIQKISDCIVDLSGISFLKLGQAIRNKNLEESYEEIVNIREKLMRCYVESMPVTYKYGNYEFDKLKDTLRLLGSTVVQFEKYYPLKDDTEVNAFLCRCIDECFDILICFKEKLNNCNNEIYMSLIAYV